MGHFVSGMCTREYRDKKNPVSELTDIHRGLDEVQSYLCGCFSKAFKNLRKVHFFVTDIYLFDFFQFYSLSKGW